MEDEEGIDKKVFNKRYALVKSLDVKYLIASIFKAQYHFSLAEAIIAVVAKIKKATLVYKNPKYGALKSEVDQRNITL